MGESGPNHRTQSIFLLFVSCFCFNILKISFFACWFSFRNTLPRPECECCLHGNKKPSSIKGNLISSPWWISESDSFILLGCSGAAADAAQLQRAQAQPLQVAETGSSGELKKETGNTEIQHTLNLFTASQKDPKCQRYLNRSLFFHLR